MSKAEKIVDNLINELDNYLDPQEVVVVAEEEKVSLDFSASYINNLVYFWLKKICKNPNPLNFTEDGNDFNKDLTLTSDLTGHVISFLGNPIEVPEYVAPAPLYEVLEFEVL